MLKSGLIVGAGAFVLTLGIGLAQFALCGPCLALFLGLGAGYLAAIFDKKATSGDSAKGGAAAGAIGGVGAILGHTIGGVVGFVMYGRQQAEAIIQQLGLPQSASTGVGEWVGAVGASFCFGLLDLALMAGLGALGGILWYQISGKKPAAPTT